MLIKSKADQKNLAKSGRLIGKILADLVPLARPGVSTLALGEAAEKLILKAGGKPAFKGYRINQSTPPFPSALCVSLNAELVHGIPKSNVILKDGDIVSLDIGMEWPKNLKSKILNLKSSSVFTDTALTVSVGQVPERTSKLMSVTRQALEEGIKAAQPGASVAAIGKAIETYVRSQGNYGIVRDLVGHGVGHGVHEEPYIPNYYDPALESVILKPGMVIAIEPMIALGGWKVVTMPDGWTIKMADNSLSAHFEHTLIITEKGNEVVTRRPSEKEQPLSFRA